MPRVGMAQIGFGLPRLGDWVERGRAARDHLLASPRFRRWAAAFPLTRPIARRRSRELFDLCAGFVYSQVLLACVRLKLFDIVADGPRTSAELARRLALPAESTERLLRAALSLRLLEKRGDDRFGLRPLGAALVDNPAVASMVEHHTMLYADMRDPVALLRGGMRTELSQYWPYSATDKPAALGNEQTAAYTALMAASQPMVAEEVLAVYPLNRHHRLLDVGGGDGTFLTHAAASAPNLQVVLYDLPRWPRRRPSVSGLPAWSRVLARSAATSSPTRCRSGRMSSRWSESSTIMTTMPPWRSSVPLVRRWTLKERC